MPIMWLHFRSEQLGKWLIVASIAILWHDQRMAKTSASTSMNISLPIKLKKYVEKRAGAGGYSTPSEYVRELIRADELRARQKAELDERLREGIKGPMIPVTPELWENIRKEARARIAQRDSSAAQSARRTA